MIELISECVAGAKKKKFLGLVELGSVKDLGFRGGSILLARFSRR